MVANPDDQDLNFPATVANSDGYNLWCFVGDEESGYRVYNKGKAQFLSLGNFLPDNPATDQNWYVRVEPHNDLDFYMGKKYVFSNRLHSLLIGVAFGAYPVCLYEESIETLKLKHVLHSSFGLDLPIIFSDSEMIDYHNLYEANIDKVNAKFIQNANNCSEIISEIVGGN